MRHKIKWVLDADIQGCFDNFDHSIIRELLSHRLKDKNIMRLINQWLKVGIVDGESMHHNRSGTPQGGICKALHKEVLFHHYCPIFSYTLLTR
jgi:RNA-directed DNA polymerase